jgi:DNA-binding HxlR family transcriptional regulator
MAILETQLKCCPIDYTFTIIGKKFTILILRNMMNLGQTRFNEFLENIEGINTKTLSARLKEMQKTGLIERRVYKETPVRIEYHLTEKGMALKPLLEKMMNFSMLHYAKDVVKDGKPKTLEDILGKRKGSRE